MMSRAKNRLKGLLLVQLVVSFLIYCTPSTATQNNAPILLNVTVTTEKGDAILDLRRESFSVNIDKRPQNIFSVSGEVPASIGILIDTSGSLHIDSATTLAQFKEQLKGGLERFVQLGHPGNEYFVMTFAKDTKLLQDWTSEPGLVTNKLDSLVFDGPTVLYDSITKAVTKVMGGRNTRHVLIVISDGHDSYSRSGQKQVRETLKRSDVVLYALGVVKNQYSYFAHEGSRALDEFAEVSGGRTLFSLRFAKSVAFTQAFEMYAHELRRQYQVAINPEVPGKKKWWKLKVTATSNDSSGQPVKLLVRTRKGYYH